MEKGGGMIVRLHRIMSQVTKIDGKDNSSHALATSIVYMYLP